MPINALASRTPASRTLFGPGAAPIAGGPTSAQMMRTALRAGQSPNIPGMNADDFGAAHPFLPSSWGPAPAAGPSPVDIMSSRMGGPTAPPARPTGDFSEGGGYASTRTFTGSPDDQLALAMAFMGDGSGGRSGGKGNGMPSYMPGGSPGDFAAVGGADMMGNLAASRTYSRDIAPNMPRPGMSPEAEANAVGYMNKLILRANGQPEAPERPLSRPDSDGWLRGAGAARPLSLTRPGQGGWELPGVPPPTSYDANMRSVAQLAGGARSRIAASNAPQYYEDPVSGERRVVLGREMQPSGINPAKATAKTKTGVEQVQIGPKTYYFHHDSKKYFDDKGEPVQMNAPQGKPLTSSDFVMSPDLMEEFNGNYATYKSSFGARPSAAAKPAAGGSTTQVPNAAAGGVGARQPSTGSAQSATAPVAISSKNEHAALPAGTRYIGPDGKIYLKGG